MSVQKNARQIAVLAALSCGVFFSAFNNAGAQNFVPINPGQALSQGLVDRLPVGRDTGRVAEIYHMCGGEPRCMAAAWGRIEFQRCRNGIGVPGGCFGPNGEGMRTYRDWSQGAGPNHDLFGRNGWTARTFGQPLPQPRLNLPRIEVPQIRVPEIRLPRLF